MSSPLPDICGSLPLARCYEILLAELENDRTYGCTVATSSTAVVLEREYWAADPLESGLQQAVVETALAARMCAAAIDTVGCIVVGSQSTALAGVTRPPAVVADVEALVAVLVRVTSDLPLLVVTQPVKRVAGVLRLGQLAPRWQRPDLKSLHSDFPGLVAYRELLRHHPLFHMISEVFGTATGPLDREGHWDR